MNAPRTILASALVLALAGLACAAGQTTVSAALQPANQRPSAPPFTLKDSAGKTVDLKKYRGKGGPVRFLGDMP